jgi:hypothetical protein
MSKPLLERKYRYIHIFKHSFKSSKFSFDTSSLALNSTFGSSRIAKPAYPGWPTNPNSHPAKILFNQTVYVLNIPNLIIHTINQTNWMTFNKLK